ncbi:DNA-directed RNA polymerase III subunit RPC3 [Chionoecetes opilio]|uniref:DNA-directed RNA polymerase III subunit RPC3 n=1 Tax=Chionoecetes opilio TaxID=41210 RepID=A0A8J8WL89_CHIOP|nr:DNA-directed RNA polymerase III subunit RPC3 [Chionoecetes opilio]
MLKISYTRSDPWDSTLNPVTLAEIRDHLKDLKHLEQYLKVLEEECGGAVRRVGDVGGGQYRLELGEAYRTLTHTLVYQIVQERLGGKAARIFRLIHRNGMMEQDQVAELAMISHGETFQTSSFFSWCGEPQGMSQSSLPALQGKTSAPGSATQMCLEWVYKSVYNLIVQRDTTHADNTRLLDKRIRVDSIVENLRQSGGTEEQVREVEEMMTEAEVKQVEKVSSTQDRLFDSEIGLDETIGEDGVTSLPLSQSGGEDGVTSLPLSQSGASLTLAPVLCYPASHCLTLPPTALPCLPSCVTLPPVLCYPGTHCLNLHTTVLTCLPSCVNLPPVLCYPATHCLTLAPTALTCLPSYHTPRNVTQVKLRVTPHVRRWGGFLRARSSFAD